MTIKEASQFVIPQGYFKGDVFSEFRINKNIRFSIKMIELSGLSVKDSFNKKGDIEKLLSVCSGKNYARAFII